METKTSFSSPGIKRGGGRTPEELAHERDNEGRIAFRLSLSSGEFDERPADEPFKAYLRDIDRKLFKGTSVEVGWRRKRDVTVGRYAPPQAAHVSELMGHFATKLDLLYKGVWSGPREEGLPRDYYKFVAWATWMLLYIHPKRDGNARLSKGFAEFLLPRKAIMFWQSELWRKILNITEPEMIDEVVRCAEAPRTLLHEEVRDPLKLTAGQKADLFRFYRWNGHDWPADILGDAIQETTVDESGIFQPRGFSREALELMTEFLSSAPQKPPPPWEKI